MSARLTALMSSTPVSVDSRATFRAFLAVHGAALREYAMALADFDRRRAGELEQEALIELWTLDPSRYESTDWPYLVEVARRTMRTVRARTKRKGARCRHGDRRAFNGSIPPRAGRMRRADEERFYEKQHSQPRYMLRAEQETES